MFISQGIKPNNESWRYILGTVTIILAMFIGQVPMLLAIFLKSFTEGIPFPTSDMGFMTFLEPNLTLFLLLLSFAVALLALFGVVRFYHKQTIREVTTARPKVDWNRIFFAFGTWALFSAATTTIDYFNNPDDYLVNFKPIPFAILFVIAVIMVPLQTSLEEYLFRGYLMQGLAAATRNKWFPLLATSVTFGLMHITNPEVDKMGPGIMVYYIGTGLFLGIVTLMDDGLELALGFHAANNLIGALLVTSDWTAFQTHSILKDLSEPTAGFDILFPIFVIFPLMLYIFSKRYNWNNWKEKLTGKITISPTE